MHRYCQHNYTKCHNYALSWQRAASHSLTIYNTVLINQLIALYIVYISIDNFISVRVCFFKCIHM